jgi:hypothetical protein
VIPIDNLPSAKAASSESLILESTEPEEGLTSVCFRKGTKNEKDLFIEVWTSKGFKSSLKVSELLEKPYNDSVFGGIAWSRDQKKIVFIGEQPEIANYKAFYRDLEDKKPEEKKDERDENKKEEHWQDEKFLYQEHFGETLNTKKRPAIYIFNLEDNKLNKVEFGEHLPLHVYPQYPVFDQNSEGIVFSGLSMPYKKLGLNFCLNKETGLYYI